MRYVSSGWEPASRWCRPRSRRLGRCRPEPATRCCHPEPATRAGAARAGRAAGAGLRNRDAQRLGQRHQRVVVRLQDRQGVLRHLDHRLLGALRDLRLGGLDGLDVAGQLAVTQAVSNSAPLALFSLSMTACWSAVGLVRQLHVELLTRSAAPSGPAGCGPSSNISPRSLTRWFWPFCWARSPAVISNRLTWCTACRYWVSCVDGCAAACAAAAGASPTSTSAAIRPRRLIPNMLPPP